MLHPISAPAAFDPRHALSGTLRFPASARRRRALDDQASIAGLLASYLQGWAEANPEKILAAAAPGYRFDDPLVGIFSHCSLPAYFEDLQARFAFEGTTRRSDLAFHLRGGASPAPTW